MKRKYSYFLLLFIIGLIYFFSKSKTNEVFQPAAKKLLIKNQNYITDKKENYKEKHLLDIKKNKKVLKTFFDKSFNEQFCFLKKENPKINLDHSSEIQMNMQTTAMNKQILVFYVNESRCPRDKYSILKVKENGEVASYINCNQATKRDLFLNTYFQYNIETFKNSDPNQIQLALEGLGYFLVMCKEDHNFYLTRDGRFVYSNGLLINKDNCFLSATDSFLVLLSEPEFPDEFGCFKKNGKCIAVVDVSQYPASDFVFVNKEYTQFNYKKNSKNIMKTDQVKFINNARENRYDDFVDDMGLPSWRYEDSYRPPAECP